ncbi:M23 family metallopeptidase [Hellea sp.]|nr:M23 family metallopeptidase [Hellea sp.]
MENDLASVTPKWQKVMRIIIAIICGLTFMLGAVAFQFGALFNFVLLAIMGGCLLVPLTRLPYFINKEIHWSFWKAPFAKPNRSYWRPILLRIVFWSLCGLLVFLSVPNAMLKANELAQVRTIIIGGTAFLCLLSLIPKRIGGKPMSIFAGFSIPVILFIFADSLMPQLSSKDAITVHSPFAAESFMAHAGHNKLLNYHTAYASQKHALDIMVAYEDGRENKNDRKVLEDYACFGARLIAPVSGEIIAAKSDLVDQKIGSRDPENPEGNHVVIKMDGTHYALLAHMKQNSLAVAVGDQVVVGQKLGECGNSGNTTSPHLHFQIQRYPDLFAKDGYTYPVKFDNTARIRRGKRVEKDGLFYIRNDRMVPN